ncbi:glutamate--tRNA ligase, cytoplasmic [Tanacetum coccineum]
MLCPFMKHRIGGNVDSWPSYHTTSSWGASRTLNLIEWDKLWNINKKIIDPVCPQHTAIVDEGRIKNMRSPNVEVALMDWGNAIVEEIKKDSDGNVTELSGKLHLEGYVKAAQLKLTWLPEINELTPLTLVEFGYLITRKKLDEDEDFVNVLNPNSKKEFAAVGDTNMRN